MKKIESNKTQIYLYNVFMHWAIENWNFLRHFGIHHSGLKGVAFLILINCIIFLPACAPKEKEQIVQQPSTIEASEETEAIPSREAVFVYSDQASGNPAALSLYINAEPVQIGTVYIRLVGIIAGENSVALVEVNGKGSSLGLGEKVSGYCLVSIEHNNIQLKRVKENG